MADPTTTRVMISACHIRFRLVATAPETSMRDKTRSTRNLPSKPRPASGKTTTVTRARIARNTLKPRSSAQTRWNGKSIWLIGSLSMSAPPLAPPLDDLPHLCDDQREHLELL